VVLRAGSVTDAIVVSWLPRPDKEDEMGRAITCVLIGLILAPTASGVLPDPGASSVTLWPDGGMASCPAGDGPVFEHIIVQLRADDLTPVEGVPWTEFFFAVTGGDVTIGHVTDATNPVGEIRFDMVADEAIVLLDPDVLTIECTVLSVVISDIGELGVNSFDLDENGCVDLTDFGVFTAIYGTADPRGDFDWNGLVGLADFGLFCAHYLHGECR
jgi:hypothetical protein